MAAPKLKPTAMSGQFVFVFKPVECGQNVGGFGAAVVCALAEAGAAKVEAQDRKPESPLRIVEDLHGVVNNLVVQIAAAQGMRMADERGEGCSRERLR